MRPYVAAFAFWLTGMAPAATVETFVPVPIHYPGSTSTIARGINNRGDIVGTYSCASPCVNPLTGETSSAGTHGFLLRDGVYTRIDVPGASATTARGINDRGTVVGHYTAQGTDRGFTWFEGKFTYPLDVPAELYDHPAAAVRHTMAVGINPQGDMVGCFHEPTGTANMHGWVQRNGEFTALVTPHYPGDTLSRDPDTMNNAISPTGEIVGFYFTTGISYIADQGGIITTFRFEGDRPTWAWGINALGEVVGVYETSSGVRRGFLRTRQGNYRSLEVQGSSSTVVLGINSRGEIVGSYQESGHTHGFLHQLSRSHE